MDTRYFQFDIKQVHSCIRIIVNLFEPFTLAFFLANFEYVIRCSFIYETAANNERQEQK